MSIIDMRSHKAQARDKPIPYNLSNKQIRLDLWHLAGYRNSHPDWFTDEYINEGIRRQGGKYEC